MTPKAEIAALVEAARDVVANYPVAAGTSKGMTDGDGPGYGSIKRLALALSALSAANPVPVDAGGVIREALQELQNAACMVLVGLNQRIKQADPNNVPIFYGIAELSDATRTAAKALQPAPTTEGEADHAR